MKIAFYTILGLLIIFLVRGGFNPKLYAPTRLETDTLLTRQQYYGELGKVYRNRIGVFYFNKVYPDVLKAESVFFSKLDTGLIFIPLYGTLLYLGFKKKS